MSRRVAIVDGLRTPFVKSWGQFQGLSVVDLAAMTFRELLGRHFNRSGWGMVNHVILGNVAQASDAANPARVAALMAGIPLHVPAYTVNRNCGSGMQALLDAWRMINAGDASVVLVGGAESMSNIPLFYSKKAEKIFMAMNRTKSKTKKARLLAAITPHLLSPRIGLKEGLTDPVVGLNMGQTATKLALEYNISREDQDHFAACSQMRAAAAAGVFEDEIIPVFLPDGTAVKEDDGIRSYASVEAGVASLAKLRTYKPFWLREYGGDYASVTPGNSSQITDGAAALLLVAEDALTDLGLEPLGFIENGSFVGCDPARMGLGPVYAMLRTLDRHRMQLGDVDLIEINEAFAAQVLACLVTLNDPETMEKWPVEAMASVAEYFFDGGAPVDRVNVNGGAIALGHPVGASGVRIVLTLLKELKRRNARTGLASLCIGGGQGGAMVVSREGL